MSKQLSKCISPYESAICQGGHILPRYGDLLKKEKKEREKRKEKKRGEREGEEKGERFRRVLCLRARQRGIRAVERSNF